jgi:hypothetical protein
MGVLSIGRPLTWSEIVSVRSTLKNYALNDLILILNKHRTRRNDDFLWGDEVSFIVFRRFFFVNEKYFRLNILLSVLIIRINVFNYY